MPILWPPLVNANDSRVKLRRSECRCSEGPAFCLVAAQTIVAGKVANSRLLLCRHSLGHDLPAEDFQHVLL